MRLINVVVLSMSLLFFGCDVVGDMKGMFEKQGLMQEAIKENYGLQSQVGWNIDNGVLTQVTVVFTAEEVREKKVSELEEIAQETVSRTFGGEPRVLNVQISCKPKSKT